MRSCVCARRCVPGKEEGGLAFLIRVPAKGGSPAVPKFVPTTNRDQVLSSEPFNFQPLSDVASSTLGRNQ